MIRVKTKAGFVAVKISHFTAGALMALGLAAGSASANPTWTNCPDSLYDEASTLFEEVTAGRAQGIFSAFELASAEVDMLGVGLCAGKISKEEFCRRKGAIVEDMNENLRRLVARGIPVVAVRRAALIWNADLATVCGAKKAE